MLITPAATVTVPSVMLLRPNAGWRSNNRACFPVLTSCSPLPCRSSYGHWPSPTRKKFMACSCAQPPLLCRSWRLILAISLAAWAAWQYCTPGPGPCFIIRTFICWSLAVQALSIIFRAKFSAALKRAGLLDDVPPVVWRKDWVVHCQPAGQGREVLNYLARYIFRVALTNSRLERFVQGQVTFRYRDNRCQQLRRSTLPAEQFIHRFLLHTLPRGCAKVRYYGLYAPASRQQLQQALSLLGLPTANAPVEALPHQPQPALFTKTEPAPCPFCRQGHLLQQAVLPPQREPP